MSILFIILLAAVAALIAESYVVRRAAASIPIRIHVNGTRGKSTVVHYIAAGLKAGGFSVASKVTGIVPAYHSPDGKRHVILRKAPARVQEQASVIRRAYGDRAEALVMECMSLSPELQSLEASVLSPTITVITNSRNDHREVMGHSVEERISSLCCSVVERIPVVTGEKIHTEKLRAEVHRRRSSLFVAGGIAGELPQNVMRENVEIALSVCSLAGVPRETAMKGIAGSFTGTMHGPVRMRIGMCDVRFVDGFAINDVDSTQQRFASVMEGIRDEEICILFNTRSDRPVRTADIAGWIASRPGISTVVVSGSHAPAARRYLKNSGCNAAVITLEGEPSEMIKKIAGSSKSGKVLFFGAGNIAGDGFRWIEAFQRTGQ